jgi:lysophospholipase L1-like esterase
MRQINMKKLFVVGDSISIQYGPYLKKMVEHRFIYDRKRGEQEALADLDNPVGANGGDSRMVLDYLEQERARAMRCDVLLVNCGLHDIKTDPVSGEMQVPLHSYREHLAQIVRVARQVAEHMIWIRTTDVIDLIHNTKQPSFHRSHDSVIAYNAAADEIMREAEVPVIDLYTFTRIFGANAYCDHVHFTDEVRKLQAAYIAGCLDGIQLTGMSESLGGIG